MVDHLYRAAMIGNALMYFGVTGTIIRYDAPKDAWQLARDDVNASLYSDLTTYALGPKMWHFNNKHQCKSSDRKSIIRCIYKNYQYVNYFQLSSSIFCYERPTAVYFPLKLILIWGDTSSRLRIGSLTLGLDGP